MDTESPENQIMLVEDDLRLLDHLSQVIDSHDDLQVVAGFTTVSDSLEWLERNHPDMLLVDLDLPDGEGARVIEQARTKNIESMVLTVFADEQHVTSAIRAGASGYLLKDSNDQDVIQSILQLLDGQSPISPAIARHILKHFSYADDDNTDQEKSDLTPKEIEVLGLISRGFSYQEVAERVISSINTVRSHVRNIYRKLEANSRGEAVYKAANQGLIKL